MEATMEATKGRYEFTPDMREISGFGGGYEATCRAMLAVGLEWLDEHPTADPQFHGFKGVTGLVVKDNDDAKALSEAIVAPTGGDCTGAMHHGVISAIMFVKANGWDAYVAEMTHPRGKAGILEDKLAEVERDLEMVRKTAEKQRAELAKRGAIIAEKVLGWKKYSTHPLEPGEEPSGRTHQMAYGPSAEYVLGKILPGDWLSRFVDDAIKAMTDPND